MANAMGKTTTKSKVQEVNDEVQKEEIVIIEKNAIDEHVLQKITKERDSLVDEVEKMKQLIQDFMSQQKSPQIINTTSQMDRSCTLVHLVECIPGLPTTIQVNNNTHSFESFGERRVFRFADMQNIVSRYRDWFERGIFTLGEDCSEFSNDFGISIMSIPMSVEQYRHIHEMDVNEFKRLIDGININQRILLCKTWIQRYQINKDDYNNINKLKILNKATDGFMRDFIKEVASDEDM